VHRRGPNQIILNVKKNIKSVGGSLAMSLNSGKRVNLKISQLGSLPSTSF